MKLSDSIGIEKIISGGQTGADQAGLFAAVDFSIETGGMVPRGWKTKNGPKPELAQLGLQEGLSTEYPPRTWANVRNSDGTIIFYDKFTPGIRCTLKACDQVGKPAMLIDLGSERYKYDVTEEEINNFRRWARNNEISVLNVAGNSQTQTNDMYCKVYYRMTCYLDEMMGNSK